MNLVARSLDEVKLIQGPRGGSHLIHGPNNKVDLVHGHEDEVNLVHRSEDEVDLAYGHEEEVHLVPLTTRSTLTRLIFSKLKGLNKFSGI